MGSNPLQKQKRVSLLVGLVVGLVIGLILCVILYMFLTSRNVNPKSESGETKQVAVLNKAIKSGAVITSADYTLQAVNSSVVPTDAVGGISGTAVSKIDLASGTVLSNSLLTSSDSSLSKDLRQQEYNMITLPTQLKAGDYIDIRLQLPDGGDYIVISKKYVQNANANTVWLNMKEDETLTMSNAIIEYYIMAGSKLYATKYTDPGSQEPAAPTYTPNATVTALIMANENVTSQIVDGQGRYTEALKAMRNNRIRAALNKHSEDEQLGNIETKLQEEIKNLKEARQSYFGTLNTLQ